MTLGDFPEAVVVYGAGGFGRRLAGAVREVGVNVRSFVDVNPPAPEVEGTPCIALDAWNADGDTIALGISNPAVDLAALASELESRGAYRVWGPVEVSGWLWQQGIRLDNYWMTGDLGLLTRYHDEIQSARDLLDDELSRETFDAVLKYRGEGSPSLDPTGLGMEHQYFPNDIPFLTKQMRYVDGGAFDGDTVRALAARYADVEAFLALEPDPGNYVKLASTLQAVPLGDSLALPLGLANGMEARRFSADGSAGAVLSEGGNTSIQVVDLDSLALSWRPTHIKLDIEGAEEEAIWGMRRIFSQHRPRLAVSAYHKPEDHWRLLNLLGELLDGYSFFMRVYGQQTFDTVVYGIPKAR
jgi:FkbM family methyltransferase